MAARRAILAAGRADPGSSRAYVPREPRWFVAVRNPRNLLMLAAICGVAFCALLIVAYASSGARWLDASALNGFIDLQGDHVSPLADRLASVGDPGPVLVLTVALFALSAARG